MSMKKFKITLIISCIFLLVLGMVYVSFTFPFSGDEKVLFLFSLWGVDIEGLKETVATEDLFSNYFYDPHFPERRGYAPNGVMLILGSYIWVLNLFKDFRLEDVGFIVLAMRFLLIGVVLLSLFLFYLLFQELDESKGKRTGMLAVALVAVFPPFVAYGSVRAADTLSLLFFVSGLWSLIRLIKSSHPSILMWIIPGLSAGIFLILKKSGPMIIPVMIIYAFLLSHNKFSGWNWIGAGKKLAVALIIAAVFLAITNKLDLYIKEIFWPTTEKEFQHLTGSMGIKKFGLIGFQVAKLWELLHPDYYHYFGFHRFARPYSQILGLINKHFTHSFFLLYITSLFILLIMKRWKYLLLLNAPFVILFLCLPIFQIYRFLPVFPFALSTIAVAAIQMWDRYSDLRYRIAISMAAFLIFWGPPVFSFWDTQIVNGETTYLDLGEMAAKNSDLRFSRGIFFDRRLSHWKADRLGTPFVLIPLEEGTMKDILTFKTAGLYRIALLLGTKVADSEYLPELTVTLGDENKRIEPVPNTLKWYYLGPFEVKEDSLEKELVFEINRINIQNDRSVLALYEIKVIKAKRITSQGENEHLPQTPFEAPEEEP